MARARAIDTRLERLVPAMEEYFVKGIFTKKQLQEIAAQRRNHEYKLVARPMLYVDVKRAIDFEMELETQIANYISGSDTQLRHRNDIIDRVAHIYQIAIPSLESNITTGGAVGAGAVAANATVTDAATRERDVLEKQYLAFLRDFNRENELSRYLASALQKAPTNVAPWVFSVEWELQKGNMDNARSIAQEALKHIAADPRAWAALLRVETSFVNQIARGVLETDSVVKQRKEKKNKDAAAAAAGEEGAEKEADAEQKNEDDDDADAETKEETVSQRFAATNPALAKVVLDGELVLASAKAATQSKALGVQLLEEVIKSLIVTVDHKKNRSAEQLHLTGKFFSQLFRDCIETALPSIVSNSDSDAKKKQQRTSVAASAVAERRMLAVSSIVSLATCPWRYFDFSVAAAARSRLPSKKKNATVDQQQPPQQVTTSPSTNKCWDPRAFLDTDDGNMPACSFACLAEAATRTLSTLVRLARRTCHPAAAKAALTFAEELVTALAAMDATHPLQQVNNLTAERVMGIVTGDDEAASAKARGVRCARCSAALDESLTSVERYVQDAGPQLQIDNSSKVGGVVTEFPWSTWVSDTFAQQLTDHHFVISALVPSAGATSASRSGADSAASSSIDAASLELRVRKFLATRGQQQGEQALLLDLDAWFNADVKHQQHSSSITTTKQQTAFLLGSETVAEQVCTLLIARALLRSNAIGGGSSSDRRRQRGGAQQQQADDSSDDDDGEKSEAQSSPFAEIVHIYKLTHPSTPKQIEIRSKCMSVVASVWLEHVTIRFNTQQQQQQQQCSFPFVARDIFTQSPAPNSSNGAQSTISFANDSYVAAVRGLVDKCASVLPASAHLLVNIGAAVEFRLQKELKKSGGNNNSAVASKLSAAQTRMRRFFETAVAQASRHRPTWLTWKQCETDLGNLQMAGAIQRRAAASLGDSRLQL